MISLVISCSKLVSHHTAANILFEFEEVVSRTGISPKVFRVVTDNASKLMCVKLSLPGFETEQHTGEDDDQEKD